MSVLLNVNTLLTYAAVEGSTRTLMKWKSIDIHCFSQHSSIHEKMRLVEIQVIKKKKQLQLQYSTTTKSCDSHTPISVTASHYSWS